MCKELHFFGGNHARERLLHRNFLEKPTSAVSLHSLLGLQRSNHQIGTVHTFMHSSCQALFFMLIPYAKVHSLHNIPE